MWSATHYLNAEDESMMSQARWEICAHGISLIDEFEYDDMEEELTSDNTKHHHGDTKSRTFESAPIHLNSMT